MGCGQRTVPSAKFQCSADNLSRCQQRSMVGYAAAHCTSEEFTPVLTTRNAEINATPDKGYNFYIQLQVSCHRPSFSTLPFPSFGLSFINWHTHLIILIPHLHFRNGHNKGFIGNMGGLQRNYSSCGINRSVNWSLQKDIPLEINVSYSNSAGSMA